MNDKNLKPLVKRAIEQSEQIKKLSELKGICYKIAKHNLDVNGYYSCSIDGIKTQIVH